MKHNRKELERLRDLAANTNPATAGVKRKVKAYERVLTVATQMGDFDAVCEVTPFTGRILKQRLVIQVAKNARVNSRHKDVAKCIEWLNR